MRKIGYARVSSADQNLDRQIAALRTEGCDEIYREKVSGKSIRNRPELEKAIDQLGIGDTLVERAKSGKNPPRWAALKTVLLVGVPVALRIP